MLTKTDLKNIRDLISSGIRSETPQIVRGVVAEELQPIKKSIRGLKYRLSRLNNTVKIATKLLDEDHTKLRRRVDKIETHLGI